MKLYFTQIDPLAPEQIAALAVKGWQAEHLAFRRVCFKEPDIRLTGFDAILITSKQAARWLRARRPAELPSLAVVGRTSSALFAPDDLLFGEDPPADARGLVTALRQRFAAGARFLHLRGAATRDTVAEGLADYVLIGAEVYETARLAREYSPLDRGGMVYFQAPSTVADFMDHYPHCPDRVGAIGPATGDAVRAAGWRLDFQPTRPETDCFIAEIPLAREFQL